jgi:hypothetical protein
MLQEITLRAIDDFFQSPTDIVDELGVIDRQIKELEATARKLKAQLTERGIGKYHGARFTAEVQEYDRATISAILVKEFGTKDFVAQVTQMQHVKSVTVKPL